MKTISKNTEDTGRFAKNFFEDFLIENSGDKALVIGLTGDLGTGKTFFTQALAKELGITENITSPTFVIEKIYQLEDQNPSTSLRTRFEKLIHIDAYRIQKPDELMGLGWEETINNPKNIIIIEWAERVKDILSEDYIKIEFEHLGGDERKIVVEK